MRKSRIALLGALALVVGALVVPAQSMATPGTDATVCTFSGATTALTDIPGILVSEQQANGDAVDDVLSAIPGNQAGETGVIVEGGAYAFATAPPFLGVPTQCLHVDVDGLAGLDPDGANNTGLVGATITANGTYQNVLCGTGTTVGNATLATPADGEVASITFPYTIAFAAGNGAAAAVGGVVTPTAGNPNPVRSAAGAGVVHIEGKPVTAGATACGNSDAADFNVFGAFSGATTS